ncbi:MAG: SDR family oxidoreductase [Anaerolineales bacterium]|nr:SDR family oxidoreductase [Anaerolineales bacterium]
MAQLQGKVAVITGGTRGLGLAIAQAYASEGAAVVVASRSEKSVTSAVAGLRQSGAQASGLAVDVGNLDEVVALAAHAASTFGRLDIWVNNAGISSPFGPTASGNPESFHQVVQTNVIPVYNGSHLRHEYFLAQGHGKLVNMLGRGWRKPVPFQNAYAASKAWVFSFTMALAKEYQDSGVGVYAFSPGMVLTDMLTDVSVIEGSEEKLRSFETIVRLWGKPAEEPASQAVWLASAATDGKTGLEVNYLNNWRLLQGVIGEGWRRVRRVPSAPLSVHLHTVKAWRVT